MLDAVFVLLSTAAFYRSVHQAYLPAGLSDGAVVVLSPAAPAGKTNLLPGDQIRSVQGTAVASEREAEQVLADAKIGDPVSLEITRGSERITFALPAAARFSSSFLTTQFLVGFLFLALGLWVWLKKSGDFSALLLHGSLVLPGFMILVTPGRYFPDPFFLSRAVDLADSLASSMVGVLFVHFTLVFPGRKWPVEKTRGPLMVLYAAAVLSTGWAGATRMLAGYPFSMDWYRQATTAYLASRSLLCLCLVVGILNILHSHWTSSEPAERRKLRWLLLGVGTGPLAFIILWQAPDMMGWKPWISLETSLAFLCSVPVCFSIAIIQHRLLNIDLFLRRGVFFFFLACIALVIYGLTHSWVATVMAAILVAVLFEAQESEKLNRMKSFFIAGVSHDLKTPLANIRMYAELLEQGAKTSPKDRKEFSGVIVGEADRLTRLIDNVLDFSKIESGVRAYRIEEVDLNAVVRKAMETFKYQFKIAGFRSKFQPSKGVLFIRADEGAVAEALINMLSNAVKYSGKAREISVATFRRGGFAGVEVRDKGIGIAPQDQGRVFQAFLRLENENSREAGGAGLGLALVKHIMDAHKGKVTLESALENGSSFTLLFPEERA